MSVQNGIGFWGRLRFFPAVLCILLALLLLGGCKAGPEKPAGEPAEGSYTVYYLNVAMTKLVPQEYQAQSPGRQGLIEELMDQFTHVPKDLDCQPALSDKATYLGSRQENQVLYVYFDANYNSMKAEQEILCRGALTRMLTQVEGIDYISIYCGDQPLIDRQGNPVGVLAASDFILNTSNVNSFERASLTLYFADETGEKLVAEEREVMHSINTSLEQLVVEQLIAGPQQAGHFATLPAECKILSISVTDNTCYINFDSSFLGQVPTASEYASIYSIVNSLSEMTSVTRVQIMVNGSQDVMLRDAVSLNQVFERKLDYIRE